jgi:hypothetical protein
MKYGAGSFSLFLVGGYDLLSAKVKNATIRDAVGLEPSHGLGDSWHEETPTGEQSAALSQEGAFFEDTAAGFHQGFKDPAAGQVSRVGVVGWEGNTIGSRFKGFAGLLTATYEVLAAMAGLTKANATYAISGIVEEGRILADLLARTANWTTTAVDNGASSANGGAGYLEVKAFSGFTGVVVKIRHSADNSVFADLITFTTVAGAPLAERIPVAGTVNRYLVSTGTVTGTGSITPMVGFART